MSEGRFNEVLGHEEIVKNFLSSNAVDFNALGKFVAEVGPSIALTGRGDYGVRFGHYNIWACFNIGPLTVKPTDIAGSGIANEVVGR